MNQIADKLNTMSGIRVLKDRPSQKLFLDKFHWLQFTCSNLASLDEILRACTGANAMCKIEEGWGTDEIPKDVYVYTLMMEESAIEPFKAFMGMPHIVRGGIKPILAKDVKSIQALLSGMGLEENDELKEENAALRAKLEAKETSTDFDLKILYSLLGLLGFGIILMMIFGHIYKW